MISPKKDWVDVLQALLTPTVALGALTIALFQARINHIRLKHEMFDRRYDMYLAVRRYIREVTGRPNGAVHVLEADAGIVFPAVRRFRIPGSG